MRTGRPRTFVLGFALAVGSLLAITVVAVAGTSRDGGSGNPRSTPTSSAPITNHVRAFERTRTAGDVVSTRVVAAAGAALDHAPAGGPSVGWLVASDSRLFMSNLGDTNTSFYGVPTSRGEICEFILGGLSGCAGPENFAAAPVEIAEADPDALGTGSPMIVYGLALDDVGDLTVVDDSGRTYQAQLRNGAFFVQLADAKAWPKTAVVKLVDGSTQTVPILDRAPAG